MKLYMILDKTYIEIDTKLLFSGFYRGNYGIKNEISHKETASER